MSATLAPRTGCYDVFTRQWIADFLGHCAAPPLPRLLEAGEIVGTMRPSALTRAGACDANTLLVAGGHDHPVAASAIRRLAKDARIDSMGTADATYGETTTLKPDQALNGLYVTLPISGARGQALIGMTEFSVTLGRHVGDVAALYRLLLTARQVSEIPTEIRPVLEEMAFRTKHYWNAMTAVGVPLAPIHATGGWARAPALMQQRANVFGEPIIVVDEPELVALGAALYAAEAANIGITGFASSRRTHTVEPSRRPT